MQLTKQAGVGWCVQGSRAGACRTISVNALAAGRSNPCQAPLHQTAQARAFGAPTLPPPPPPSPTPTQGGTHSRDLPWINAHLNTIGRTLILSILAFTACLWAARALGAAAWAARFALVSVHLALLAWDHGGDFQHHGFYNW